MGKTPRSLVVDFHKSMFIFILSPLNSRLSGPSCSTSCTRKLATCRCSINQYDEEFLPESIFYRSPHSKSKADLPKIKSPDPERYFGSRDYSHCFKGWFLGQFCIIMAIVSFSVFNAWTVREDEPHDEGEEQEMAVSRPKSGLNFATSCKFFLNRLTRPTSTQ